jgi:exo-beta-1,3-glucanase (GH17 family)
MFKYNRAINYSGYRDNQSPLKRIYPTKEEILEDLKLLEHDYYYLRLFDCSNHAYKVLEVITENNLHFSVMLGLSLAAELNFENHPYFYQFSEQTLEKHRLVNEKRIQEIIDLSHRYQSIVSSISIGNEVLSPWVNNLIGEKRLTEIAAKIKSKTQVPVTYCEEYQYWLEGLDELANTLDFISIHTYPAWRNIPIEKASLEAIKNYQQVKDKYPNKTIIITETGWPTKSHGSRIKVSEANETNQKKYIKALSEWSVKNQLLVYFFEAFDEPWKGESHPDEPEKHWGLYDVFRKKKW